MDVLYERVAAIDVGKKEIAVAVRLPSADGQRTQQMRKFKMRKGKTFYPVLARMVAWLSEPSRVQSECAVTHVSMESTGVYWRPVFHALCEADPAFEVLLVNAAHVKNVPGRKTDANDAQWLAQLLEVGLLRGRFIPPQEIQQVREVTRYRKKLIENRTSELQRLAKVLEDAGVKIDSVASSLTTASARDMIEALIAGERDERALANLARGVMRKKIPDLSMALAGRFQDHHALLARLHLDHIDHLDDMIARLDRQVDAMLDPFDDELDRLRTIPGIATRTSQVVISEIGTDMSRSTTAEHLASWAGLCPSNNESAGKHGSTRTRTRKGNLHLRAALIEAAWSAGRTDTYLGARYRRLERRFGKKNNRKAAVALAHDLIIIIWHVLHDQTPYHDLGADYFTKPGTPTTKIRTDPLVHDLQALGWNVNLTPAA